jgi:putative endopeptidase
MKVRTWLAGLLAAVLLLAPVNAFAADDAGLTRAQARDLLIAAADDYNSGVTAEDVMHGDENGDLNEDAAVTRVEALVMLTRAFGDLPEPVGDSARKGYPASNFTDIPGWAQAELENVWDAGIIAGTTATTFSPAQPMTEAQLELLISRVYALFGTNLKDDFYAAVNKEWLDSSALRPGLPISGTMYDLMFDTAPMTDLINQTVANPKGEDAARIAALYNTLMDWDARNAAGVAPIRPYLDAIDSAASLDELMAVQQTMVDEAACSLLMGFGLTSDAMDSTRYAVGFEALSPSLTKEIYAADGGARKEAYLAFLRTMLTLSGYDEATAAAEADRFWQFEKALAPAMMDPQEYADVDKTYNVYTMAKLKTLFPHVDLDAVYAQSGLAPSEEKIIVVDPGLLEACAAWFDDGNLETLRTVARLNLIVGFAPYLSHDFQDASDAYSQAFLGTEGAMTDEESATQIVQALLSDELGRLYAEAYFSPEAKADVENMVQDFIRIYKERIRQLDWMSEETKARAIGKLDTLGVKVGYPDDGEWNDFLRGVTLKDADEGGSYFDNIAIIMQAQKALMAEWQTEPVDKGLWPMSVFTVNACYVPTNNEIVFPAGILQAPMYDVNASREENLGGIGYVIAHEITHAFDNNGAKYDKDGNAADWWTEEDYAAFQKLCGEVVAYYDGTEAAPGITCNGTLTLSENIADLGAASCILEAARQEADPDLETMFRAMARTWASTMPRETAAYYAQIDLHAPDKLRGSRVLQTLDAFYETFGIQPGDGMYLAPEARVQIW